LERLRDRVTEPNDEMDVQAMFRLRFGGKG